MSIKAALGFSCAPPVLLLNPIAGQEERPGLFLSLQCCFDLCKPI